MDNFFKGLLAAVGVIFLCFIFWLGFTPSGLSVFNSYNYTMNKVDEYTNYQVLKEVEDTCRSMQSSYEADRLAYEQYNGQEGEKQTWAEQAKMRANRTAATYNEYILKNSYVWSGNVPDDIQMELPYIE